MSAPKPDDWTDLQSAAVSALLGILLRADAQHIADDTPGGVSMVTYRVAPDGRRLAVDVTVHGAGGAPIAGFTL
jgi:hypothetical protein